MLRTFDNRKFLAQPFTDIEVLPKQEEQEPKTSKRVKKSAIYAIICHRTKYVYVGLTQDIETRFKIHKSELKNNRNKAGKGLMQEHYNLYKDAFEFLIISDSQPKEKLLELETEYISDYRNKGYNMYNQLYTTVGATIIQVNSKYAPVLQALAFKLDRGELDISELEKLLP